MTSEQQHTSTSRRSTAACTIIARNYLPQARILIDSYLRNEPAGRFYLFIVDGSGERLELGPGVRALSPADVDIDSFREMSFKYDVTELCTAVKPSLLRYLLFQVGEQEVVYLDPDTVVFRPLHELWQQFDQGGEIVLIPHLLQPIPLDGHVPDEKSILISGAFNLGFIAVRQTRQSKALLRWWEERLRDHCRIDVASGLFVDQRWIDLVPGMFDATVILRDETYDVAYWNLHSLQLERVRQRVLVNGRELAFFHFSGYDPVEPRRLSKYQNRISIVEGSPLAYLLDAYADELSERGFQLARRLPYGYARFNNGFHISRMHRHLFGDLTQSERDRFGDPFDVGSPRSFFAWSVTAGPAEGDFTPFLESLLKERPDLTVEMPDPRRRDRKRYLAWAETQGAKEMGYEPVVATATSWTGSNMTSSAIVPDPAPGLGVNVCGYLRDETGIGNVSRGFVSVLRATGVPVSLTDISEMSVHRSEDRRLDEAPSDSSYGVNLVCVNADQHFIVKDHVGAEFFKDRYNVGIWAWELPAFPNEWRDRFEDYDELWVGSSFIVNTLAPISPIPVIRIPPPITTPAGASRELGRQRLQVDEQEFLFLFVFDFGSYFERKNPLAVIEAFKRAFPDAAATRARLVIKCVNEQFDPAAFDRMLDAAHAPGIDVQTGYWDWHEMPNLMAACDAYVSLHRSEGTGLTIAEAMALGKPVIGTAWSGNIDFMTPRNSFPVPYELVRLDRDVGPYRAGNWWAEPSVEDASQYMRLVFEDRTLAERRGTAARADIERGYSIAAVGDLISRRMGVIFDRQSVAPATRHRSRPPVTSDTRGLQPPTVPQLDLNHSRTGAVGLLAKRAAHLLVRYHTHYQWQINTSFAEFMQNMHARMAEQDNKIRELGRDSSRARAALEAVEARIEDLNGKISAIALERRHAADPPRGRVDGQPVPPAPTNHNM